MIARLAPLLPAFAEGVALGLVFFGGLWLTVRRLPSARHPARLLAVSLVLRMAVVGGGAWLIGRASPARMAACGIGILAARPLATRRARSTSAASARSASPPEGGPP